MRKHGQDPSMVEGLALRAMAHGATVVSPGHIRWDVTKAPLPCLFPQGRDFWIDYDRSHRELPTLSNHPIRRLWVEMFVRCRKCERCKRVKSWEWSDRAMAETASSAFTLFATMTLSPEAHLRCVYAASQWARLRGKDFAKLPQPVQFQLRASEVGKLLTGYQKVVRKHSTVRYRFLWVCEAHKSGDPHLHGLVHAVDPPLGYDAYTTYEVFKRTWTSGWSDFCGVDKSSPKECRYVCKYLSKENSFARVRASLRYGLGGPVVGDLGGLVKGGGAPLQRAPLSDQAEQLSS